MTNDIRTALAKAEYKESHWKNQSGKLMRNPHVQAEIAKMREKVNSKAVVSVDWIINRLKEHAECDDKDVSIKAIAELNKMAGNYAPTKNINLNLDMTLETVEQLGIIYKSS